jgi:Asp-tRNA(Asn)/Glu-tRNA(Gln) amidotransferase C subunit
MLDEVDTSTVEPVAQITGIENIHHADGRVACEKADALLEQSPQGIRDHMIQVKNVF